LQVGEGNKAILIIQFLHSGMGSSISWKLL